MSTPGNGRRSGSAVAKASYFDRSELPLASLLFLLPAIIAFEVLSSSGRADSRAFRWMEQFFGWFGASGRSLPMLAVIGILLTWHIARRDRWRMESRVILLMGAEALILSLPLLALQLSMIHWTSGMLRTAYWRELTIAALGAGIYEELVFRLVGLTVLSVLLVDILRMPKNWAALSMVLASAVLFSVYHNLGYEHFEWRMFAFRTIAGVYFGGLFLTRGFGITAGTHISYDLILVGLLWLH